MSIENREVVLW